MVGALGPRSLEHGQWTKAVTIERPLLPFFRPGSVVGQQHAPYIPSFNSDQEWALVVQPHRPWEVWLKAMSLYELLQRPGNCCGPPATD